MGNLLREPELKPSNKPHLRGEDAQKEIILDSSAPDPFFFVLFAGHRSATGQSLFLSAPYHRPGTGGGPTTLFVVAVVN
jgi:hypothetical protein